MLTNRFNLRVPARPCGGADDVWRATPHHEPAPPPHSLCCCRQPHPLLLVLLSPAAIALLLPHLLHCYEMVYLISAIGFVSLLAGFAMLAFHGI